MPDKIRVGVIGTSWWSDIVHLPGLKSHPLAEVVALCGSSNRAKAEEMAAKYDIPHIYMDYHQLLKHDGLDAVVIVTPDDLHYPMTMEALDAGLHIICEKPLALNTQQAQEMYEKAEAKGVKHMVLFTYRWFPYFRYMKHLIEDGYIGRCFYADFRMTAGSMRNQYNWRFDAQRANGAMGDLGSHMIDFAHWYFGDIDSVNGQLDIFIDRPGPEGKALIPANDYAAVNLRFVNGAQGTIRISRLETVEFDVRLCGEKGYLEVQGFPSGPRMGLAIYGSQQGDRYVSEMQIPGHYTEGLHEYNPLDIFVKHKAGPRLFVDSILEDKPAVPNFLDGLKVQQVIDAVMQSNREGCWVDIDAGIAE